MKKLTRYIAKNWILMIAGLILTKTAIEKCYEQRGGFYIGGEWCILPAILMIAYLVPEIFRTMLFVFGEEDDEDAGTVMEVRRGMETKRNDRFRRGGR